eukprot:s676_g24.t1
MLRLTSEWHTWLDELRYLWRDLLHEEDATTIGLISPNPPSTVFQGHAVAHFLILQQVVDEPAGIVSGVFRSTRQDTITQAAQVLPVILTSSEVIDLVRARVPCNLRTCLTYLGNELLAPEHPRRVQAFTSVVTEVFPLEEDVDDFTSFMAAGRRSRITSVDQPVHTLRHAVRQPDDVDENDGQESDSDSGDSYSQSEDETWSDARLFSVHQPPVHGLLNCVNPEPCLRQAARSLHVQRDNLLAVHRMPWPPEDLQQAGEAGALVQFHDDLPDGSHHCFALVDVDFHPRAPGRDPERVRSPIYLPQYLTRGMLLRGMELALYCTFVQDKCIVWHNGVTFRIADQVYLHLRHGDHLHIAVPPPDDNVQRVPTRCVARILQMDVDLLPEQIEAFYDISDVDNDLDSMPTQFAVVDVNSSDYGSDVGPYLDVDESNIQQTSWKPWQHHDQTDFSAIVKNFQKEYDQHEGGHPQQPPLDLPQFERDLRPLWHRLATVGPGGMELSAPVAVWYNDHVRHPLCDAPRVVSLYDDITEWRFLLAQAWRDYVDATADLLFYLVFPAVEPNNPHPLIHILLLQQPHHDYRSVVVSVSDSNVYNGIPRSWALMVPGLLHRQTLIDVMGYRPYCTPVGARCVANFGDFLLDDQAPLQAQHGMFITLSVLHPVASVEQDETSALQVDATMLLQKSVSRRVVHLEDLLPEPMQTSAVRLFSAVDFLTVPDIVEIHGALSSVAVEQELMTWGHDCRCWLDEESADLTDEQGVFLEVSEVFRQELDHMKRLYLKGYMRAALEQPFVLQEGPFHVIRFRHCLPKLEAPLMKSKLPWPARLRRPSSVGPFFQPLQMPSTLSDCALQLGISHDDINNFFGSADNILCKSVEGLSLPEHVVQAIERCTPNDNPDRLLIYCDGSSLTEHRRRPPLRVDEEGHGDTWAFLVLSEQYIDQDTSNIDFLGWTAQPVLFHADAPHYAGAQKIGSETSEREALFWSSLWRLAQNTSLPTTFCTDSTTAERQGAGLDGASDVDLSFRLLRAVCQGLQEVLGPDGCSFSHVAGHSGDCWNDLVDLAAKQERQRSFLLPRQRIDLRQWSPLPAPMQSIANDHSEQLQSVQLHVSFGSANVQSLFAGPDGYQGKTQLVRDQMRQFGLTFLGIQESRAPEICGLSDNILRLGAGADRGHWGVELWIDLQQPIAHVLSTPVFLTKQNVIHCGPQVPSYFGDSS